jgi:hypothetical protein
MIVESCRRYLYNNLIRCRTRLRVVILEVQVLATTMRNRYDCLHEISRTLSQMVVVVIPIPRIVPLVEPTGLMGAAGFSLRRDGSASLIGEIPANIDCTD